MTLSVTITVHPLVSEDGSVKTVAIYTSYGNNKKRDKIHTFTTVEPTWIGHIWDKRDLILQEEVFT